MIVMGCAPPGLGLRFGMRSVQQRRPGRSQRRPGPQNAAPVDKPVFGSRLVDHFSLHGASEPRFQAVKD
jgi:hypothetical protein